MRVSVGRILKVFGIHGEVVVDPTGDDPRRFEPGATVYLHEAGDARLRVASQRQHGAGFLVIFEGVEDRTAAEDLVGRVLFQDAASLPPLPEGTYYHFQLVGLTVTREDGGELGRVVEILDSPGTDLIRVRGPEGEWLIPSRKEFVAWVDLKKSEIRLQRRDDLLAAQSQQAPAKESTRSARPHRSRRSDRSRRSRRSNGTATGEGPISESPS